jgi:hypothetical protein
MIQKLESEADKELECAEKKAASYKSADYSDSGASDLTDLPGFFFFKIFPGEHAPRPPYTCSGFSSSTQSHAC